MKENVNMDRNENLSKLLQLMWSHSNPAELAGYAATILSNLNTKSLRSSLEEEESDEWKLTEKGKYSRRALIKIIELAEEFQKEFKQPATEKYGEGPLEYGECEQN